MWNGSTEYILHRSLAVVFCFLYHRHGLLVNRVDQYCVHLATCVLRRM